MEATCTVYGLKSSNDDNIRYIGQTTAPIGRRLREHVTAAQNAANDAPVQRWIRKALANGFSINIVAIEQDAELDAAEIHWIAHYKSASTDCLNVNPGGDRGARGVKRSLATRLKMCKPRSESTRQKMRKAKSSTHRANMSIGQIGNTKARGEANRHAKLSTDDVVCIRSLLEHGESGAEIARRYGVQRSCVSKIKQGRSWAHI